MTGACSQQDWTDWKASMAKCTSINSVDYLQSIFKLAIMEIRDLLLRYSELLAKKIEIDSEISDIERKFNELANKC